MVTWSLLSVAAAALALIGGVLLSICSLALLTRPGDGGIKRDFRWVPASPFCVFWLVATCIISVAEWILTLKPAPMRAAELATCYVQSQVLFALVDLGVPDSLAASGPLCASELAAAIGPAVNVAWLERLLDAAVAFGMLSSSRGKRRPRAPRLCAADSSLTSEVGDVEGGNRRQDQGSQLQGGAKLAAAAKPDVPCGSSCGGQLQYGLTAVSGALCSESPVCMKDFVRLFERQCQTGMFLAEGVRGGVVPFELWSAGKPFWQHLADNPREAQTFDAAMHEVNHIGGGAAVAAGWPWGGYECVCDVAGGVGGFLAGLLGRHSHLRGVVLDQPHQIERAKGLWATTHASLAPRVRLLAGNMFDASTIPSPAELGQLGQLRPGGRVAYTLRNILHDWSDADSGRILAAIRSRISQLDVAGGRVVLLLVEMTTAREVLPSLTPFRRASDLTMLANFGNGQERSKQQMEALLAAAGFRLTKMKPTNGIFVVIRLCPCECELPVLVCAPHLCFVCVGRGWSVPDGWWDGSELGNLSGGS